MRPAFFLFATLLALVGFAADAAVDTAATKNPVRQTKGQNVLPESVEGVPEAEYTKIRRALLMSYGNESISAARNRLNELKERTRFTKGRNESEDLRLDFEKARDAMVKATIDSVLKLDPSINKDSLVITLNAIEEATKKRGQEATQRAREKEAAEAKLAKKDAPEAKPETAVAAATEEKPMTPAQLLADVEGVSAEDMTKFRIAAFVAQKDPTVKELKAKQNEMRKEADPDHPLGGTAAFYEFNCTAVEVEVDRETGDVVIARHVIVSDVGTALNPLHVRGQDEVAAITEAAMRGEITDFADSLRRRVKLLAGLPAEALERVYTERLRLNPGAETLVSTARAAGLKVLLVSGGFTFFTALAAAIVPSSVD